MILRRARRAKDSFRDAYHDAAWRSGFEAGVAQGHTDERAAFLQRLKDLDYGYRRIGRGITLGEALRVIDHEADE